MEALVVTSKVKKYIKEKSECNTSGDTIEKLTEIVQKKLDKAVESAKADGRKTVMARDFED